MNDYQREQKARRYLEEHIELLGNPGLAFRSIETRDAWIGTDDAKNGNPRWLARVGGLRVVLEESFSGAVRLVHFGR